MVKHFKKATTALVLVSTSSLVFAQSSSTCEDTLSSYSWYLANGYPEYAEEIKANHPACFSSSSTGASQQINATSFTQAAAISQSIAARLSARQGGAPLASNGLQGLAAGGVQQPWNVWGSLNQNDTDVSYTTSTIAPQKIKGSTDVQNTILGVDYALNPAMVVGLSVAWDDGDGWSRNITGAGPKLKNSTDGYIVAPYFGYQINKEFALDLSAGVGNADFSTTTTKADVDRWFAAANLSYNRWVNNFQFTGKLSYLHGDEDTSDAKAKATGIKIANTDTSSAIDQLRLGAQVGYWMNGVMPYAGLGYTSNIGRSGDANDDPAGRSAFVATLGLNFFSLSSKVSGGIMYEQELDRNNSDNQVITANINFRF